MGRTIPDCVASGVDNESNRACEGAMADKVIVTHAKALASKYGPGQSRVDAAVDRMIAADAKRGIRTRLVRLDVASDLPPRAVPLYDQRDMAAAKLVVDEVFVGLQPDYLMILGGPDIIPHQRLDNSTPDLDDGIASDLPYACDAAYGTSPSIFMAPGRVVGRLPDLPGANEPDLLEALLDNATAWIARPRTDYAEYFGIAAEAHQPSANNNLAAIFGSAVRLQLSPDGGPNWTRDLDARVHFILCHGFTLQPKFYGQRGVEQPLPVAHLASYLPGRISSGTVVAAECCYGAELYGPGPTGQPGICASYLASGAYGYFGSTGTAYSCANGNNYADLITRLFLLSLLNGASLGRAALEARQQYAEQKSRALDAHDLKTIAEFVLLGDPSIHPIESSAPSVESATVTALGIPGGDPAIEGRRQALSETASELRANLSAVGGGVAEAPEPDIASQMRSLLPAGSREERFDRYPLLEPDQLLSWHSGNEASVAVLPLVAYHVLTAIQPIEGFQNPLVTSVIAKTERGRVTSLEVVNSA